MAKKDEKKALDNIFGKTEETPIEEPKKNLIKPTTFGLSEFEREELQEIANENSVARNAVGRYAIQYFIKQYKAGKAKIKTVKVTKLQAP